MTSSLFRCENNKPTTTGDLFALHSQLPCMDNYKVKTIKILISFSFRFDFLLSSSASPLSFNFVFARKREASNHFLMRLRFTLTKFMIAQALRNLVFLASPQSLFNSRVLSWSATESFAIFGMNINRELAESERKMGEPHGEWKWKDLKTSTKLI